VLHYGAYKQIISASDKLNEQWARAPREEAYYEAIHSLDKGDWLADALFAMSTVKVAPYASFIAKNTAYSTQHGVKGEEYPKVVVVCDDVEAAWNIYNFSKTLTPETAGKPTEGQHGRGRRLAYVSFSRALEDLRILFFTANPAAARQELIDKKLAKPEKIEIVTIPTTSQT
jgi:DNA helicase II / ATP-dependent DNA helicase PcrA